MANTPSAKKRARQAIVHRERNVGMRSKLRTFVKRTVTAIEAGNKGEAEIAYKEAVPVIDSITRKGLIHKNKAARYKSRLNKHIHSM